MTPSLKTECISNQPETPLTFGRLDGRNVVAEFNGGHISSEGGLLLIRVSVQGPCCKAFIATVLVQSECLTA